MTAPGSGTVRKLGLTSAVALVVANMIGAGVFTTSGLVLADLRRPHWVLLAWLAGGAVALLGALSYGALARRLPESGGEYHFLSRTVHPLVGFLAGWVSLLAGFTAPIAASALGLQAYLAPVLGGGLRPEWIGTTAILVAALMHGLHLGGGVLVQNFAVGLKLLLLTGLVLLGLARLPDSGGWTPLPDGDWSTGAFAVSLVWIFFSYSGWNAAVYLAGEVKNPDRNLHRALLIGTLVVTVLYLGLNAVFLYSAPPAELAGKVEVGAVAAQALGGTGLRSAVSLLIALALFTSVSAMVMAGPRVYARMAEDGLFPRFFLRRGETHGAAVALQAVAAIAVVWVSDLAALLGYIGFTLGLSAAATVAGLMLLRRREGPQKLPVPGYPWVPLLFILITLGASAFLVVRQGEQALWGIATVAAGLPLYALFRWRQAPPAAPAAKA